MTPGTDLPAGGDHPFWSPCQSRAAEWGCLATLREILQQPATWLDTVRRMESAAPALEPLLRDARAIALTGSGSSEYAGRCVELSLQRRLALPVETVPGGRLLALGADALSPVRPLLLVSVARSGNSPESAGALAQLQPHPDILHLAITCNAAGALARLAGAGVTVVVLDERTNDRSLVMTSSFTNLAVAAWGLGCPGAAYRETVRRLASGAARVLFDEAERLARVARRPFRKALYLGTGVNEGAAREAALKMLEMTAGRVHTMAESFLGLRHGPMSAVDADTLVAGFFSADPHVRAYECDLIRELDRKQLRGPRVLAGAGIPADLADPETVLLPLPEAGGESVVWYVLVGQLLAFFRCLEEGLRPDAPSESGVITRVVGTFQVYPRNDR